MTTSHAEHLGHGSALGLLAGAQAGRVIYTAAAMPAVWPTVFRPAPAGGVLLRTPADSGLAQAVGGTLIAFEVDGVHESDGSGWCVTPLGRAVVGAENRADGTLKIHILPEAVHGRVFPTLTP